MKTMRHVVNQKGFTLIEILVTISVLAIVLTIAGFSFRGLLWRNQVNTATNDFVTALNFARSEAVTRGQTVTVCRSVNGTSADVPATPVPSCSTVSGAGYETGYIVFVDSDADGVRDANEALLRVVAGPKSAVTIIGNANVANRIRYQGSGFAAGVANGTVEIASSEKTLKVIISANGRVRIE